MFRVDAQHSFAPPAQGPDWYGKILARNKFEGSIYTPHEGPLADALALAERFPYIRRIVPSVDPGQLHAVPDHPLIVSVHLTRPDAHAFDQLLARGLAAEIDARFWPFDAPLPVALLGLPGGPPLPANISAKLIGFRLPVTPEQTQALRQLLRHPGPDQLMFASGWPHAGATWKETLAAFTQTLGAMPMELREQLLGGTARTFYKL